MRQGERQADPDHVAPDHFKRYEFAAQTLAGKTVYDAGCGTGYGSRLLAQAGCTVLAVDNSEEAIQIAKAKCDHPNITWIHGQLETNLPSPEFDAIVAFEILEHLIDPETIVKEWHTPSIFASVPHEAILQYSSKKYPFHHRHFFADEFEYLLHVGGFNIDARWGQVDKWEGTLHPDLWETARTLIAYGVRAE